MIAWCQRSGRETLAALVILVSVSLGISACGVFTAQNAKTALDITQTLCVIEKATLDDATIGQVCGIEADLMPLLKQLLAEQRKQIAAARRAGACEQPRTLNFANDNDAGRPKDVTVYIITSPTTDAGK